MAEIRYLISDAAKKVDVESHVLRYWEDELELQIPRNEMGHRYYTDYYIRLFRQIKELKEKGYQLKAIKNALNKMSGAMEDIIITEDYMEEDMKAAWKESRRRERQMKERERAQREAAGAGDGGKGEGRDANEADSFDMDEEGSQNVNGIRIKSVEEYRDEIRDEHEERKVSGIKAGDMAEEAEFDEETELGAAEAMQPLQAIQVSAEKMVQFQNLMNHVIGQAMEANMDRISQEITNEVSENVSEAVSEMVSDQVTDRVMKEVEYLMRISDEREEERFRQLDETIRAYQKNGKGRAEAAATKIPFFKKKRFGKSGKKLF